MLTPQEIQKKLDGLEKDMHRLLAENARLIRERESAYVERDSCLGLAMQLAVAHGYTAGVKNNTVIVDLPCGQVSWEFEESEAHLFENLPEYQKPIEEMTAVEKYRRVMNPGIF